MIKINVVAVGKLKDSFFRAAADEYIKRLGRFAVVTERECKEGRDEEKPWESEGKEILSKLSGHVVLLDVGGREFSSEEFSEYIDRSASRGVSEMTFVIGGSRGVSEEVKRRAELRLGFGKMTFPHGLARVMLFEQLYRAFTIINGLPYHK